MKKINPKRNLDTKRTVGPNNCSCPVMTMTAQFFFPVYPSF